MSDSPWVKWYTDDFLGGVSSANLKADEIGVYAIILTLIADRGAPIEDDRAWVAGRAGTSTRRLNQIIDRLVELGKIQIWGGMIGNRRMLTEVKARDKKSDQARAAAFARHRDGAQPQLDLEDIKPGKKDKKSRKSAVPKDADASRANSAAPNTPENNIKPGKNQQERENSAIPDHADASHTADTPESDAENCVLEIKSRTNGLKVENKRGKNDKKRENSAIPETIPHDFPSCARARSESQSIEQTPNQDSTVGTDENENDRLIDLIPMDEDPAPAAPPSPQPGKLANRDLIALLDLCAAAAGFYPNSPGAIAREIDIVKRWRDAGISFDETIVPTIEAKTARSSDPTSSLARFDREVLFQHAKRKATVPSEYRPPSTPNLQPKDEDPAFRPLRAELLKALGVEPFCRYANETRFIDAGDCGPGRKVIRIVHKAGTAKLDDFDRTPLIRRIAKRLGFSDVW